MIGGGMMIKKQTKSCSEEQITNIRQLFEEFKECDLGINFVSWMSIDKNGESNYIASSLQSTLNHIALINYLHILLTFCLLLCLFLIVDICI